jgi:hypothetical protein
MTPWRPSDGFHFVVTGTGSRRWQRRWAGIGQREDLLVQAYRTRAIQRQRLDDVIALTGCSRGTVSNYLNELERETGCPILRGKRRALKIDGLQTERGNGQRRASVHDFHSFRVTWITLALAAGVPLELVQRVTGHRTASVVLKHYFRPGRADFSRCSPRPYPRCWPTAGRSRRRRS